MWSNKTIECLPSPPASVMRALEPFEVDPCDAVRVVAFEVFTPVTRLIMLLRFAIDLCVKEKQS